MRLAGTIRRTVEAAALESPEKKPERDWRPAAWSSGLALALYAITLGGTYVYDDVYIVQLDPRLRDPWRWIEFWTRDYFNGGIDNLYRPLVSMSYAIQTLIHGNGEDRAWLFHLVNWLLHGAVSGCVAEFTRRISSSRIALIAGLLFAAHPIHVEVVANIVGRAELMCGLGIMCAMLSFIWRPMSVGRAIDIWAWFVLALLSKEQGMLLPLALLISAPLRKNAPVSPDVNPKVERLGSMWLFVLLAWTLASYVFLRENTLNLKFWWERGFLDWTINPLVLSEGAQQWLVPVALIGRYVALLVAPVSLSLDYGANVILPSVSARDPYLYLGLIAITAWIALLIVALRRRRWLVACALMLLAIFYSVVANIATLIGVNFAERLMYIPSIFFLIIVARYLAGLRRRLMIVVVSIVLALLSLRTVTYAWQWNDRMWIYRHALEKQPKSLRAHLLLAEELRERKEYDRAEEVLARARGIEPDYWRLWLDSAVNQAAKGDRALAAKYISRAAGIRPSLRQSDLYQDLMTPPASLPATVPATVPASAPSR